MDRSPLVVGLAAVFAGMTVLLFVLAAVFRDPVILFIAVPFAGATYLFWYHASGRIREGIHERARRQRAQREAREARGEGPRGGFGAGPRFSDARTRTKREARAGGRTTQGQRVDPGDVTRREAYRTLGLEQDADESAVKRAYREKVKDVHPDRGGDEEEFKELTRAYERLTD
ncbi:J domain-containing protein [Halorarius litoreus]|uniref:J domain-containing protein n=1 Tax=Halorarius litoreus TaxID=2962676 RepID=UPI0020CDDD21|nr:DnaJ domain-containing protein [Halorarius litoreus]